MIPTAEEQAPELQPIGTNVWKSSVTQLSSYVQVIKKNTKVSFSMDEMPTVGKQQISPYHTIYTIRYDIYKHPTLPTFLLTLNFFTLCSHTTPSSTSFCGTRRDRTYTCRTKTKDPHHIHTHPFITSTIDCSIYPHSW